MIKKKSLVDQVYEHLREGILTLRIPLGSKLNVNELQNDLEVSCTPIREAVNRLQQEGLVTYENNVGAHVLTLDAHDVEEIQQLAMALHCAAIRLAMERGKREAVLPELERQLEEYRKAKSVQAEVNAINRFLGAFYRNCGNRRLDKSMLSIQGQQLLLRHIYVSSQAVRAGDGDYFRRMLDGAGQGDGEAVCAALQEYTDHTTPEILRWVEAAKS